MNGAPGLGLEDSLGTIRVCSRPGCGGAVELLVSTRDSGGPRGVVPEYAVRCSGAGCEYRFKLPDATTDASIDMGSRCACGGPVSDPTYKLSLRVKRPPPRFANFAHPSVVCVFCDRDLRDYVAMMRDAPAGPTGTGPTRTTHAGRPSPVQSPMTSPPGATEPSRGRGGTAGGRGSKRSRNAGSGARGAGASKRGGAGARGAGLRGGGGGRAGAKCYNCQGMGHWANECPRG